MSEQNIVEITRKKLDLLGYPDPADCLRYDNSGLAVFAQDDYKNNAKLRELLAHSSKCTGRDSDKLWSDEADYGKPEFTIINSKSNLAIVIECKNAQKSNNLISPAMRDNKSLMKRGDISRLRIVLSKLHETIYPCMVGDFPVDIIGKFYHEFLKYSKNSSNNGIKLTPSFVTDLFCDLADLKPNDTVLDPCSGTGGFLVASMHRMFSEADQMSSGDVDGFFDDLLKQGKIDTRAVQKYKDSNRQSNKGKGEHLTIQNVKEFISKKQLCGSESDPTMYALGCSNMILRGDGKSNILHGDCMNLKDELLEFEATVGMMNPPYSETKYNIMEFVINLCECVKPKSKVVVIVPTSCAHSDEYSAYRNRLLKRNTLLGVISMNLDLFKGIAGTVTCVMIFEAGKAHNFAEPVYWGNWKDDGFVWHKKLGRIPDKHHNVYQKLPNEYKKAWLSSYRNFNVDDQYGIWRKLTSVNGECQAEWLWEYFVETDYTKLTQREFEDVVRKYMLFQLHELEIEFEEADPNE